MKKCFLVFCFGLFFLAFHVMQGQVLLAKWTFPTGNPTDSLADGGLPVNLTMAIRTEGGTSAIDFSKNGATTKAAQATGWDNGAMTKYWVIRLNTVGYEMLKLSSKQQTGGNNPGPRDFMVQYRIGTTGTWADVPNSTMITANNWTSALLDSIDLPEPCKNQSSLYLRWIMTTNINSTGGTLTSNGINKIDDIYITGKAISTAVETNLIIPGFTVSPNPSTGPVTISSPVVISSIEIIDMSGRNVYTEKAVCKNSLTIHPLLIKGNYLILTHFITGQTVVKQFVVKEP